MLIMAYVGLAVGANKGDLLNLAALGGIFGGEKQGKKSYKILDTSVIIDGRIADIAETGFLDGLMVIPQFVLRELQLVADSADSMKRNRGRRGLDILQRLQKMPELNVQILEDDFPAVREVDMKLIELAKVYNCKIVTNDFNLNKVAQLHGVEVLNINELANSLKPIVLPGELMRVFIDEHALAWDEAWGITCKAFAYTNHTLLPEALERWSIGVFGRVLPRHLEIVYDINAHFLQEVRMRFLADDDRIRRMSIIDESGERYVRMAHLACAGSHAINGVAELHTELLKRDVLKDFYELWPRKFSNKTNGVTPRRWMALSNPHLSSLITEHIGDGWIKDLSELERLEPLAEDPAFRARWRAIKQENKRNFAALAAERTGILIDPSSMFDVLVKRIHEYKRQHLKVLHIVSMYLGMKSNPTLPVEPRTFIFGGKAAPGYHLAKIMIKLITAVGDVINRDPDVRDRLRVVFLPNFNVTNGQRVYPAADLSEQISTAGKEASGTGNMKFCMNGALTIGTMDGANIELREEIGAENFFLFGLSAQEVHTLKAEGYRPMDYYAGNAQLKEVIDLIRGGFFSHGDTELFRPLMDNLMYYDPYMLFADFASYVDCQAKVSEVYRDGERWTRMAILNTARSGKFSSDRTIREYCSDIWKVRPVPIHLLTQSEAGSASFGAVARPHPTGADLRP